MRTFRGIAISPGIAIGPVVVYDSRSSRRSRRAIRAEETVAEQKRLDEALEEARRQAEQAERDALGRLGPEYAAILAAHVRMIGDPSLRDHASALIESERIGAEDALTFVLERHAARLESLAASNPYLSGRASDIRDILQRILDQLHGGGGSLPWKGSPEPAIILAHQLSPSETADLSPRQVCGFATETGGLASHTAIVAAALELPAVAGIGSFLEGLPARCGYAVIDGDEGLVVLNPDDRTLERYRQASQERSARFRGLAKLVSLPAQTLDGATIELLGNIEFPEEAAICQERGAEGIGLYRTEFLYLGSPEPPDENFQYAAYARVVQEMRGKPVTIRTLDLGADKLPHFGGARREANPFLGLRSLRLSLREPNLFRTQLRAILRASVLGDVRVMFPLVSSLSEFRAARELLNDVASELIGQGVPVPDRLPLGVMIEVPSAAIMADKFAREADFLSIGTNDLVQYALAVDRDNPDVADLFNSADPAVVRLIAMIAEAARAEGKSVSVCGAMGGDPRYSLLLLGLGVSSLSMPPHQIPEVKRMIRGLRIQDAREIANQARGLDTAAEVELLLADAVRIAFPDGPTSASGSMPMMPAGGAGAPP